MKPDNKKFIRISVISVAVIAIGLFSLALTKSDVYRELARSQRLINEVYKSLITRYADRLDTEKFTKTVINNILDDLDPYTVYMEEDEKEGLDLLTRGKYGGVGINLGERDKKLTVISARVRTKSINCSLPKRLMDNVTSVPLGPRI